MTDREMRGEVLRARMLRSVEDRENPFTVMPELIDEALTDGWLIQEVQNDDRMWEVLAPEGDRYIVVRDYDDELLAFESSGEGKFLFSLGSNFGEGKPIFVTTMNEFEVSRMRLHFPRGAQSPLELLQGERKRMIEERFLKDMITKLEGGNNAEQENNENADDKPVAPGEANISPPGEETPPSDTPTEASSSEGGPPHQEAMLPTEESV